LPFRELSCYIDYSENTGTKLTDENEEDKIEAMGKKEGLNSVSVHMPKRKKKENLLGRLRKLSKRNNRSVNYLVVEAI
jgi:hypothetical protein